MYSRFFLATLYAVYLFELWLKGRYKILEKNVLDKRLNGDSPESKKYRETRRQLELYRDATREYENRIIKPFAQKVLTLRSALHGRKIASKHTQLLLSELGTAIERLNETRSGFETWAGLDHEIIQAQEYYEKRKRGLELSPYSSRYGETTKTKRRVATDDRSHMKRFVTKKPSPQIKDSQASFRARKIDFSKLNISHQEVGEMGEDIALRIEQEALIEAGRADLAEKVIHTSKLKGDGTGFDIESFFPEENEPKYIEVKTTTRGQNATLFFSRRELNFLRQHPNNYLLYCLYGLDRDEQTINFLRIYKGREEIEKHFQLVAYQFQLKPKEKKKE